MGDDLVGAASTTVLIAVEDSESEAVRVVRSAHRLFGDEARYFVINVGIGPYSNMGWADVSPIMSPRTWYPAVSTDQAAQMIDAATTRAEQRAAESADAASIGDAIALGEVGDPAAAIMKAAHRHGADVVVIGSHDRPWFAKLFTGSVGHEVLREADLPVLIIK